MLENIADLPQSMQIEIMRKLPPGSVFRLSETSHFWNEFIDKYMEYIVDPIEVYKLTFDATQSPQILLEHMNSHKYAVDLNSPKLRRLISTHIVIKNFRDSNVQAISQLAESLQNKQIRALTLSFENSIILPEIISALKPENLHCCLISVDTEEIMDIPAVTSVKRITSDMHSRFTFNLLPFIHSKRLRFKSRITLPLQPLNHVLEQWQCGRREIEYWKITAQCRTCCSHIGSHALKRGRANILRETRMDRDMDNDELFRGISSTCLWSTDDHGASIVADRSFGHTDIFTNSVHSLTRSGGSGMKPGSSGSESGGVVCCRLRVVIMKCDIIISEWLEDPAADRETVWEIVKNWRYCTESGE